LGFSCCSWRSGVRFDFDTGHGVIGVGLDEELTTLEPHVAQAYLNDNAALGSRDGLLDGIAPAAIGCR
jgi:hypothetical protein